MNDWQLASINFHNISRNLQSGADLVSFLLYKAPEPRVSWPQSSHGHLYIHMQKKCVFQMTAVGNFQF